jgi:hypothetical protein
MTIETHHGALIYLTYSGLADLGLAGYQRFLASEPIADDILIRPAPTYQTRRPAYQWLTRLRRVGIRQIFRSRSEVCYEVYALC